jgi:hypothetical protein
MSTFIVNGQEKELRFNVNGIDISRDFIGNTSHEMDIDDEGRYIATTDEFDWWHNTITAHEKMNATIAAYKEANDPDEVDRVVNDWIDTDLDNQPAQVIMGLEQVFGKIQEIHPTDEEIEEELRQLSDDTIFDDYPETEQEVNHL